MSHKWLDMGLVNHDWKKSLGNMERYIRAQKVVIEKERASGRMSSPSSTSSSSSSSSSSSPASVSLTPNHQFNVWLDSIYANKENAATIDVIQYTLAKNLSFYSYDPIQITNVLCVLMRDKNITVPQAIVAILRHAVGTPIGHKSTL
jgi:hypothetical protein